MDIRQTLIAILVATTPLCLGMGTFEAITADIAPSQAPPADPAIRIPPPGLRQVLLIVADDLGIDLSRQ